MLEISTKPHKNNSQSREKMIKMVLHMTEFQHWDASPVSLSSKSTNGSHQNYMQCLLTMVSCKDLMISVWMAE